MIIFKFSHWLCKFCWLQFFQLQHVTLTISIYIYHAWHMRHTSVPSDPIYILRHFMLLCIFSVIYQRWCQNVVRIKTKKWHMRHNQVSLTFLTLQLPWVTKTEFLPTISNQHQLMRIKKNINEGIINWSNNKFSKITPKELYSRQWGELLLRSWELKG